jgi:uncharacterized membrane protein YoaK (UPF0700 family)
MTDTRHRRRTRTKLIALVVWCALCVAAIAAVVISTRYQLLILVALVAVAPFFMLTSGFWQWSNSRPNGFRDWLRR